VEMGRDVVVAIKERTVAQKSESGRMLA
jgi:hypothetical protein